MQDIHCLVLLFLYFATVSQASTLCGSGLVYLAWPPPMTYFCTTFLLCINHRNVPFRYNLLRKKFPATSFTGSPVLSDSGLDLLNKLLTYDPEKVYHICYFDFVITYLFLHLLRIQTVVINVRRGSMLKMLSTMSGFVKFPFPNLKNSCLRFLLNMIKTGDLIRYYFSTCLYNLTCVFDTNICFSIALGECEK
jgi:hypothetical protein